VAAGADNAFNIDFHEKLKNALSNGTQKSPSPLFCKSSLSGNLSSVIVVSRPGMKFANSTLTANRGDHPSSTIAGGGKSTTESAGNYTTCVDATHGRRRVWALISPKLHPAETAPAQFAPTFPIASIFGGAHRWADTRCLGLSVR